MSAVQGRPILPSKAAPAPVAAFGRHKTALLERANPGIRRSTPDSEALASSDDEIDHSRPPPANMITGQLNKPARRTSWLNEIPSTSTRRASTQFGGAHSPNPSLPSTPATDLSSRHPPAASPNVNGSAGWINPAVPPFPWPSTGIWNENRKDPAARFQNVMPSPGSVNNPGAVSLTGDLQHPLITKSSLKEAAIPFSIPLHPTPKTYRSQSYSVGQLDPESATPALPRSSGNTGRNLVGNPTTSLPHRPLRPNVLVDLGHDSGTLGRVREVEDDEEKEDGSETSLSYLADQARTIEQLTRENTLLKQAASCHYETPFRTRTGSGFSVSSGFSNPNAATRHGVHNAASGDLAIDDQEDGVGSFDPEPRDDLNPFGMPITYGSDRQNHAVRHSETRNMESAKRAQWQTSLGFGGVQEIPQSRRHSFADVPTRQGSISSADRDEGYGTYSEDTQEVLRDPRESTMPTLGTLEEQNLELEHLRRRLYAASYFSGPDANRAPLVGPSLHQNYINTHSYGRSRHLEPQTRSLFIVTFKCCRADVFYIQEGTGLQVKPGELVIVEADRGTDLGTVAHSNVPSEEARRLKDQYAEEHYKWLMLFSQQSQTGGPNATNPNGLGAAGAAGSAVGGMGPPSAQGTQDAQAGGDLKPKLIRRLAQNHEIQTLRDKEGNEAKAKRVCQSKVAEHRLNMEILDAEFQMDWKKLTFYYFADAYINFNSLVTDLFKIYKTRIWMSAINPASFVTPTSSLNVPPPFAAIGMGPSGRDSPVGRRRQPGHNLAQSSTGGYSGPNEHSRGLNTVSGSDLRNAFFTSPHHPAMDHAPQHGAQHSTGPPHATYRPSGVGTTLTPYSGHHYAMFDQHGPGFPVSQRPAPTQNRGEQIPNPDWSSKFPGLTLGGS